MLKYLGNETRADQTVQMYRLSFPLVVRIWHKLVLWREIKTPAHLRHCRASSKVKSLHLGPAMSPESPAPREPGIQWCIISERFYCSNICGILLRHSATLAFCIYCKCCQLKKILRPLKMSNENSRRVKC